MYLLRHLHTYSALPKFLGPSAGEECGDPTLQKAGGWAGEQRRELSPRAVTSMAASLQKSSSYSEHLSGLIVTEEVLKGT